MNQPAPDQAPPPEAPAHPAPADPSQALVLPPEKAQAFMSGQFGLPAGSRVHVTIGGKLGTVPAEQLQATLSRPDAAPASAQQVHEAEQQRKFGDGLGMLGAGAAGLARGATAGLSDPLIVGTAGAIGGEAAAKKARETLDGLKEVNPTTSTVSELGGAIAPLAFGDAAGAAGELARGAGGITRGIASLGEAAGGVAEALPEGAGFLSRLARSVVREGVDAGVQTALYNAGSQISEDTLGDTETNGEKLWSALGHGFLLGAAGGGLLAGTGEVGREILGRAAPAVKDLADEATVRAFNLNKKTNQAIEKTFGEDGVKVLADRARTEGLVGLGDNIEQIATKTQSAVDDASQQLKDVVGKVGVDGVSLDTILDPLEEQIATYAKDANGAAAQAKVQGLRDRIENIYNPAKTIGRDEMGKPILKRLPASEVQIPFEEVLRQRRGIEKDLDWLTDKAGSRAMKNAGRTIEDAIVGAGDKIAEAKGVGAGSAWKDEYLDAKQRIHQLLFLNDAANNALAQRAANRGGSLGLSATDSLAAAAGAAGGIAAHGVIGGLHGLALGAAHHVVRERGNATAAVLLDKLSAMGGIQNALRQVDTQIARGVDGVLTPGRRAAPKLRVPPHGSHEERVDAVMHAATNPDAHAQAAADAVAPLAPHAPMISNSFQRSALRATALLATKIPPGTKPSPSITPQFDKPRSTASERAEFDRLSHLTHDPIGYTFDRMDRGTLTKVDVDTFGQVAPGLLEQVRTTMKERLGELKKPLPYAQRLQAELLLGLPDPGSAVGQLLDSAPAPAQQPTPPGSGKVGAPKRALDVSSVSALGPKA